ncbi:ABC transporter permease [Clostridium algidicarnis]|uniref:ABC transporter permease n=1 Tax=Clostridium algidicarnis TaxID=37659 RepID=UPI00162493F4|nr:ABC transporter permease [Clostridium algidicarnis]MBB6697745.1 ABC transporter permease [Clostridium algidicarnis]
MILREYVKGDISLNKKSYISTIITIFLAVVILSTFVFGVSSYYKSYRDIIGKSTGGYHFRIVNTISSNDAKSLQSNRYIKKLGLFNNKVIEEGFGSKEKTELFEMDENSLSTIESWLKEGSLPSPNEIMISNDMAREINKNINDNLEVNGNNYIISGIYYDTTYEYEEFYNIFLNVQQDKLLESGEELSPFIWYKNIFKTYSLIEEIVNNLETKDITYNYNLMYLDRSFVFDPQDNLLKDHTFQVIVLVLFFILIILFYFIITNLFLVQEAKSIQEYSKLKAIGATSRDINKIIKLKALYISQIPILLGMVSSIGIIKLLFLAINKVEMYFSKSKNILESTIDLNVSLNFKFAILIYILSLVIIYLSTKKPIHKLKKSSILNGLKGEIKSKSYKKYDLKYKGNIEKDLSKQFYKNSKKSFKFTGITLKLGFALMAFIIIIITYYSIEERYNNIDRYTTYGIQGEYPTISPLNQDLINDIKSLNIDDFINFRSECVYIDYNEDLIDDNFKNSGSLNNLEKNIISLKNTRLNIIGLEDNKFNELVAKRGLDPSKYKGNRVLLLNTVGDNFNIPTSRITDKQFLKEDIETLYLSEYGNILDTRGYEFALNVEDKIDTPLFDYPIYKNRLNCYMPKSEYIKLFSNFEKIASLDQFEYIAIKSDNVEKTQTVVKGKSLDYFKDGHFSLESKVDEDNLIKKRTIIGNILATFFSVFFIVVGFSNCYFAFYNLFLKRKDELILYKSIGMDETLLRNILKREKNKILFSFISSMPIILIILAIIVSKSSKVFTVIDILTNINYIFIFGYVVLIYISISKMYNNYKKEII